MGIIQRECPHCHTKNSSFRSYGEITRLNTKIHTTAFYCEGCQGGYFAEIACNVTPSAHRYDGNIELAGDHYVIVDEYPRPEGVNIPDHVPENIQNFYRQAVESMNGNNFDAAAIMARKVLEVSVKTLLPVGSGSLYNRIESMADEGLITKDLKEWAHILREDGNEAAHEEQPVTEEFTKELISFAEIFLMYTFTMPGMVESKQPSDS